MRDLSELYSKTYIEQKISFDLSKASTFRIGGIASLALFPKNEDELILAIRIAVENQLRFELVGNGSNILFSDDGFDGVIIFTSKMNSLSIQENIIMAQSGVKLAKISSLAIENSLSGFEFAHSIPGTVGGAIIMNAGAYGGEMSNVVLSSRCFDVEANEIKVLSLDEHDFNYRSSIFANNKSLIMLSTVLKLQYGNKDEILEIITKNSESRKKSQPLDLPNCGSFYKRPQGYFAAKLIDDAGLKGFFVGGAMVSPKHAGFIVNTGSATSKDVISLAEHIENVVYDKFGVKLEREVKYIF